MKQRPSPTRPPRTFNPVSQFVLRAANLSPTLKLIKTVWSLESYSDHGSVGLPSSSFSLKLW